MPEIEAPPPVQPAIKPAAAPVKRLIPHKYGLFFPRAVPELELEINCWRANHTAENGGLGREGHFWNAFNLLWPKRIKHEWMERRFRAFNECDFISLAGCGGSGKTDDAAYYAGLFWAAAPRKTTVILTSTTKQMLRRRLWPPVRRMHRECATGMYPGELIDSKTMIRLPKEMGGDDKSAIFGIAVKDGSVEAAAANIQGMHNDYVLVIIDEATDTPPAIFNVLSNLRIGAKHFQVIVIGNPTSRFDEHGKFSTPLNGWESVGLNDTEWQTQIQLDGKPGLCQRFRAQDSPAIITADPKLSFLVNEKDLESVRKKPGFERTPEYWKYYEGFWPTDGVCNTVLSENSFLTYGGMGRHDFLSDTRKVASLDPAFGGNQCILRLGTLGNIDGNRKALQLEERFPIHSDAGSKKPVDYQIAHAVMDICKKHNVAPDYFAMDSTGTGRGVAAILHEEWSPYIKRVEFGGQASESPVGADDARPCREVYFNRVTELWFNVRESLMAGQVRGFEAQEIREFSTRTYEDVGRKLRVQPKDEMKTKYSMSPDDADAVAVMVELCRKLGMSPQGKAHQRAKTLWRDKALQFSKVYEPDNLYASA